MDNASDHEDRIARSGMSSRFRRLNASGGVEIRLGCRSTVFVYRFYAHACGASRVLVGLRSKTSLAFNLKGETKKMKKRTLILIGSIIAGALSLFAYGVSCPLHYGSSCWPNGKISPAGAKGYSCSCGDEVWSK